MAIALANFVLKFLGLADRVVTMKKSSVEWLSELLGKTREELGYLQDDALEQCTSSQRWVHVHQGLQNAGAKTPDLFALAPLSIKEVMELYESAEMQVAQDMEEDTSCVQKAPLLDMQQSYMIGRLDASAGPCQIYTELEFEQLDLSKLEHAVRSVVKAEPLLRAKCAEDNQARFPVPKSLQIC